jgi:hypothetical protein
MTGFTKLWSDILTSSIWNEGDKTRIVWITMLACMGPDSMVRASVGGLAHQARVSIDDCRKALDVLMAPDPDSRSKEFEGRRIEARDGGFFILNGGKHRESRSYDERKTYMAEYMREYRAKHRKPSVNNRKQNVNTVNSKLAPLAQAEEEADADKTPPSGGSGTGKPVPPPRVGQKLMEAWNGCEKLTKIKTITPGRERALRARAKDQFFRDNWQEGIRRVVESDFCTGKNKRGWVATFDWFIRPDTLGKLIEGQYDNRSGTDEKSEGSRDKRNTGLAPITPKLI